MNKKLLKKRERFIFFGLSIAYLIFLTNFAVSAQVTPEEFHDLGSSYQTVKIYPALTPKTVLKIGYGSVFGNSSPVNCGGNSFSLYQFDVNDPNSYVIVKKGNSVTSAIKINSSEIDSLAANGVVYISLESTKFNKLRDNTTNALSLNIGLRAKKLSSSCKYVDVIFWDGKKPNPKEVQIPEIKHYTSQFTPNIVPDQELIDKSKKTVGQFQLKLDVPSLVANRNGANLYFKTDNLLSTNGKDKNSKVEFRFGAERSLLDTWFVPGNIEAKINGDQRAKNATFVLSGGIKTKLPWGSTRNLLFNSAIKAPVSPIFEISAQYHRRIKQDLIAANERLDKNAFALFNQFSWNPIQLLPGKCKTDKTVSSTAAITPKDKKCLDPNEISLEIAAKNWYFPFEKAITGTKVRKFESRIEVSLLIPLSKFQIFGSSFISTDDGDKSSSKKRLRVTYQTGANDASGFKHSTQFLFGFEVIK